MVEQKATLVCLLAQESYPEARRATLATAPPIGYLLRIDRETESAVYRCIYAVSDGRKIHDGPCRFGDETAPEDVDGSAPAVADEIDAEAGSEPVTS
ncbi:MAG TPA: hypothetical protein VHL09_13645 [Dehalococcoidia bacterium]|nr:hypothetical protein [Dehalococcoidia bacterium]